MEFMLGVDMSVHATMDPDDFSVGRGLSHDARAYSSPKRESNFSKFIKIVVGAFSPRRARGSRHDEEKMSAHAVVEEPRIATGSPKLRTSMLKTSKNKKFTSKTPLVATDEVYSWQEFPLAKEPMLKRKAELLNSDLASDPALLVEWFVLIQQLDLFVRSEVAVKVKNRKRSNSLPLHVKRKIEKDKATPEQVRRKRAGTFQGRPMPMMQQDWPMALFNTKGPIAADRHRKSTLEGMKERLAAKDRKIREMHDKLQRAHRMQLMLHPSASNLPKLVPFQTRSVTVVRDEEGSFGIQLKSTPRVSYGAVRISAVKRLTPDFGLKVRDVIVEVEGEYLLQAQQKDVVKAIKSCGEVATFIVANPDDVDRFWSASNPGGKGKYYQCE